MGGGGVPSGGVTPVYGRRGDLPKSGNPIQELIYMWMGKKFKADGMIMKDELFVIEITIIRIRITHILFSLSRGKNRRQICREKLM